MKKLFFRVLIASALVTASTSAWAGELKLTIANGRVTLIAQEVPLRQILTEWARVGQTRIVNAEKLAGPPLTLQLVDVPEKDYPKLFTLNGCLRELAARLPASDRSAG